MSAPTYAALEAAFKAEAEDALKMSNRPLWLDLQPLFLHLAGVHHRDPPRPPVLGPPTPSFQCSVFELGLREHGLYATGGGWDGESGYLTDDEVRELRDFLNQWSSP